MTVSKALSASSRPVRLAPAFYEKDAWGSHRLSPWFPDSQTKIGEVWFAAEMPLLIKFLFTTEPLSVQVHPDDRFASQYENSRGKTEMWHILRSEPGARIALGFQEELTRERLREASLSGEIEHLLRWMEVQPGQTYFVPAGTVHAIGAGLALCEIQQFSDITYRLYDYHRPRELHLDKALQVADLSAYAGLAVELPVRCPYFYTDLQTFQEPIEYKPERERFHVLIVLEGDGRIGGQSYRLGEAWYVPADSEPFILEANSPTRVLRTWVP